MIFWCRLAIKLEKPVFVLELWPRHWTAIKTANKRLKISFLNKNEPLGWNDQKLLSILTAVVFIFIDLIKKDKSEPKWDYCALVRQTTRPIMNHSSLQAITHLSVLLSNHITIDFYLIQQTSSIAIMCILRPAVVMAGLDLVPWREQGYSSM